MKQIENEALFEVLWRGFITTLGKKQTFFLENLIPCAGFFRGCMVYDDTFLILKGEYDETRDPTVHLPFSLEAYEETTLRYRLKGRFVKYDIEMTMEQVGSQVSIPMTLQLSFKSVPCTIYSEPYKTILPGRCKISHVLLVVFYNNDTLNVFCGKRNKQGVFVARHMKDRQLQENIILRQTKNPRKVNSNQALTLLDEKSMIGYVIELHNH